MITDAASLIAYGVLAFVVLHLVYEFTLNRGKTPILSLNVFAQRAVAHLIHAHAPTNIIDLGAGYGALARRIARAVPTAHVTGIEWAALPVRWAQLRQRLTGPANLTFLHADFMAHDISGYDAVVLFLSPRMMEPVAQKLRTELKPGALVIAAQFPLPGWQASETITVRWSFGTKLFIYRQS